jgi:hypothetical protein
MPELLFIFVCTYQLPQYQNRVEPNILKLQDSKTILYISGMALTRIYVVQTHMLWQAIQTSKCQEKYSVSYNFIIPFCNTYITYKISPLTPSHLIEIHFLILL